MLVKLKQILLLGNKGQIGREIATLAKRNGIEVIGCDIDECDITKREQIKKIFDQHRDRYGGVSFDVVINAAAYTAVDKAEDEPEKAYAINCDGVENLALVCKTENVPLLHLSTDYVFSGDKHSSYLVSSGKSIKFCEGYTEHDEPAPMNVYGKSKLAGERALQEIWEKHIILRVSWVFGKYGNNFVKTILRAAKEKEELNVVGDQRGCPTEALDIARVLLVMAGKRMNGTGEYGVYHYCGSPVTTWHEFAKKIIELAQEKQALYVKNINRITTADYPTKARRPLNSELAVEKIEHDFNMMRDAWIVDLKRVIDELL